MDAPIVTLEGDESRAELEDSMTFVRVVELKSVLKSDKRACAQTLDILIEAWQLAPV